MKISIFGCSPQLYVAICPPFRCRWPRPRWRRRGDVSALLYSCGHTGCGPNLGSNQCHSRWKGYYHVQGSGYCCTQRPRGNITLRLQGFGPQLRGRGGMRMQLPRRQVLRDTLLSHSSLLWVYISLSQRCNRANKMLFRKSRMTHWAFVKPLIYCGGTGCGVSDAKRLSGPCLQVT